MDDDLRYPIGKFEYAPGAGETARREWLDQIAQTPERLRQAVAGLNPAQLDTPYRPGGWTVRQVVHHLADSHLNSYMRFRLALTEEVPTIKAYYEDRWAELADARTADISLSLTLLDALHQRWTILLGSFSPQDWEKSFRHSELGLMTLEKNLALYAWHGRHHTAHITGLRRRQGW